MDLSSDFYRAIQIFMINHPEDPRTLSIKQWFCENYQPYFLKPELQQALTENTDTPFLQKPKFFLHYHLQLIIFTILNTFTNY